MAQERDALLVKLGERITSLRERKGLSITLLAAHADMSRQHLSSVEHGKAELCLRHLRSIAKELNTTMSRLLSGL
jgi:transcriptional regulator with XRE-family HTH domain